MQTFDYPLMTRHGPGPLQAFVPGPEPDVLAECAVAFANVDGGAIVIGLTERGAYAGPVDGGAVVRALAEASARCVPRLPLDRYEILAGPGGPVIAVRVPRSTQVHALADGRVLVREGATNRELGGDEIRAVISARAVGDFDSEIVPGATPRDLDPELLATFMTRRADVGGRRWTPADPIPLLSMGAVTPQGQVTVAGLMLFGRDPQRWLPDTGARFVRLLGSPSLDTGAPPPVFQVDLRGALVPLLDQMWDTIQGQMPQRGGPDAQDDARPDYPTVALREALVNAVCHRDYRLRGTPIEIRLYADQLVITSPGGLPGYMTGAHHVLTGRYSRNPRISWGLFQWGYIDAPGHGVLRMLTDMDRHGHRAPEIEASAYRVSVRLFSARPAQDRASTQAEPPAHLNPRQRAALDYVRAHGSLTFAQFRAMCADAQVSELQRDLSDLVQREHLRKIGPRTGAYYIMP